MPKFSKSEDYPYGLDVEKIKKLSGQLTTDYPGIINIFFRSLFTNHERQTRRFKWLQRFRRAESFPMKQALREYLDVLEKEDLRSVLKNAHLPVYFINGQEDTICDRSAIVFLKELCPQAQFSFFEKCGHFPFLSMPYEFNEVLEKLLKECP
jgi:pimeloyl-[acyl-carrier protein] methyl ester esterase